MKIILKDKGNYCFDVFDNDCKVGIVELLVDDKYWLNQISVEVDGKNYGSAIIEYLSEKYKPFRISLSHKLSHYHNPDVNDTRSLTPQGFHLAKKCFEKGILNKCHFEFPYPEELNDYKSDRFLDNMNTNMLNLINGIILKIKHGKLTKTTFLYRNRK